MLHFSKGQKYVQNTSSRPFIILIAVLCALTGFARAFSNTDIENFYNLPAKKQNDIALHYYLNNQLDSALLLSNIQVNKFMVTQKHTTEECKACCATLNLMGLCYMRDYYNYQLGAKYLLKAKNLAQKYNIKWQYVCSVDLMTILNATRNDLENNYAYSPEVISSFKDAFRQLHNYILSVKPNYNQSVELNENVINLVYLALKYDLIDDIMQEVCEYRTTKIQHAQLTSVAQAFCNVAECCKKGDFEQALACLQPQSIDYSPMCKSDSLQTHQVVETIKYYLLMKCGRVKDAEGQLLRLEKENQENNMTFELLEVLNMLQLHYEQQGDNAKAHKYELLYYKTKDEFMGKCMLAKVDEAALDLKLEESNEQMRELNYKHRTQGIVMWSAIIIAVLLATILVGLYVNYRKTKRTNRLLYEKSVAMLNAGTKPAVAATESVSDLNADGPTQADRELMEKITEVMENSPEIYDDSFSLQRLTELVGVNIKYVSRAINTCRQCNFKVLLNEYRIKEACRRLMDNDTYGSYTIESIGNSVGFASRSNFTTVFKNVVGITPATFQKMHRKPQ